MRSFFKKYQDILLAVLALLLIAVLVGYYIWGVRILVGNLRAAFGSADADATTTKFDIEGARKLGVIQNP